MEPKITSITLSVNDLEKSVAFYRDGLGFPSEGIDRGGVCSGFFQDLDGHLWEIVSILG